MDYLPPGSQLDPYLPGGINDNDDYFDLPSVGDVDQVSYCGLKPCCGGFYYCPEYQKARVRRKEESGSSRAAGQRLQTTRGGSISLTARKKAKAEMNNQCEGWRRTGGAFSLGPVSWKQCEEVGIAVLTVEQDGKTQSLPSCQTCWNECIENNVRIVDAKPIGKA